MTRLELAREFLKDAELCLQSEGFRSAASRSYYAVFHACVALLEHYGYVPANFRGRAGRPARRWEHKIVTLNFHIEFVQKRRLFPWRFSTAIRMLYNNRVDADYKPWRIIPQSQAEERFRQAKEIVERVLQTV